MRQGTKTLTRVMVVDDVEAFLKVLKVSISLDPYIEIVAIASTGEEAMEKFHEAAPDLVLLDFRLPGISGLETAKEMKRRRSDVKIALVTAYSAEAKQISSVADVDEVIPKSEFSRARIQHLLKRV